MGILSLLSRSFAKPRPSKPNLDAVRRSAAWAATVWDGVDISIESNSGARSFVEDYLRMCPPIMALTLIDRLVVAEKRLQELDDPDLAT